MDIFKIMIQSDTTKDFVKKQLCKAIKKKLGSDMDILINNFEVKNNGEKINLMLNAEASMDTKEFFVLLEKLLDN